MIEEFKASYNTITLDDVVLSVDFSEGDPNSFSLSGTVYGSITIA